MGKKLKILIVADEVWNDEIHANNVLSNWFNNYDAEFAEIYCSPGSPKNNCCENYFQITDLMMARSFSGKRAGRKFKMKFSEMQNEISIHNAQQIPSNFYRFMKSITGEGLRLVRDLMWMFGKYDKKEMQCFIDDFAPDIIFCPRLLSPKLLRLERIIAKMTDAPFVAFTADDEASLMQVSYSPIFWSKRLLFRNAFKKHTALYKHYFTFSEEQAIDYHAEYGIPTSTLFKSGDFTMFTSDKKINSPIRLVYAGRLYCNRWKTLATIGAALKEINAENIKMTLDIYTQEIITKEQHDAISPNAYVQLNKGVTSKELLQIYREADIALHVESLEKKFRYATRVSFSTKIIDLMASSCAIMAICWEKHAGYQYLKKHDAAFCISDLKEIQPILQQIVNDPKLISEYRKKSWVCGESNHNQTLIQKNMYDQFQRILDK